MIQYDNYALGCCHTKRLIHLWLHQMFDYAEWCKIFIVCSRSFETVEQKKHSPKDFKASWDQIRKKDGCTCTSEDRTPFSVCSNSPWNH